MEDQIKKCRKRLANNSRDYQTLIKQLRDYPELPFSSFLEPHSEMKSDLELIRSRFKVPNAIGDVDIIDQEFRSLVGTERSQRNDDVAKLTFRRMAELCKSLSQELETHAFRSAISGSQVSSEVERRPAGQPTVGVKELLKLKDPRVSKMNVDFEHGEFEIVLGDGRSTGRQPILDTCWSAAKVFRELEHREDGAGTVDADDWLRQCSGQSFRSVKEVFTYAGKRSADAVARMTAFFRFAYEDMGGKPKKYRRAAYVDYK